MVVAQLLIDLGDEGAFLEKDPINTGGGTRRGGTGGTVP